MKSRSCSRNARKARRSGKSGSHRSCSIKPRAGRKAREAAGRKRSMIHQMCYCYRKLEIWSFCGSPWEAMLSDWQIWSRTLWQICLIQSESTASHGLPNFGLSRTRPLNICHVTDQIDQMCHKSLISCSSRCALLVIRYLSDFRDLRRESLHWQQRYVNLHVSRYEKCSRSVQLKVPNRICHLNIGSHHILERRTTAWRSRQQSKSRNWKKGSPTSSNVKVKLMSGNAQLCATTSLQLSHDRNRIATA